MAISQELLQAASLNRWTLNFKDKRLETFYRQYALPHLRRKARIALLLGSILYGLYSILDVLFVPPELIIKIWYLRSMALMIAFAVLALTYTKRFSRYNQLYLAAVGLFSGLALLANMHLLPEFSINYFYTGLILITFWSHSLSGLRFINASLVTLLIMFSFNYLFFNDHGVTSTSLTVYNFFILGANIMGGFSSYLVELQHRSLFLREKELDRQRQLQQQRALHDSLTGLPNRELLHDRITQALSIANRNSLVCAGLFLDLNKFKPINDVYGHAVGDLVLQEVAQRFKRVTRDADTLSRLGGDEFFILAKDIKNAAAAKTLAKKLQQQLAAPLNLPNVPVIDNLSVSIGICMFPYKDATAVDIIRRADHAMYKDKRDGKQASKRSEDSR